MTKKLFCKGNLFYIIIFVVSVVVIFANRIINGFDSIVWVIDLCSFFSVLYVIFTARHTIWGIVCDLIASVFLVIGTIVQHVWLNAFMCIFISVPMLTIGIFRWKNNEQKVKNADETNLFEFTKKSKVILYSIYFIMSILLGVVLYFLESNVFYFDAIYSVGCAIGVVLSSRAYIDQFYVFMVADIFGLGMYLLLTIQNINNLSMVITEIIFIIGNFKGLIEWKKIQRKNMLKEIEVK